ncbi:putative mannose-ethanolamine phosphotransferase [Clavispora lusitaniae]|uniref:Mannose-ethanolamine phosphotransferase n=1 Tax=Clavispora lusitaniae TaxID=36911 RepID=A0AA91Q1M5_CLALS|nr:putative mannose-ethanolamine phosphotransferase [Clavispora lusitaniae]
MDFADDNGQRYSSRKVSVQQQQQQARLKFRQSKLRISFYGYIVVLVFLAILQSIGVFFFTKGFLLSRQVLPNIAECDEDGDSMCLSPKFDKAVVLVIDALRFDFAIPVSEDANPYYHNNFPILYELAQSQPKNSLLLKFIADPPTTTLQRLKGLTTGSLPTFIDAGSNFDGDAIDEDNWLLQLHRYNKSVAFMGDDTWKALFSEYINPDLHFPYDSLNVWDLHTVDNGVLEHLHPLLEKNRAGDWDVLIGHFLGVDHAGHRYGPDHFAMKEKLQQMNEVIKETISKIDDKTLLVVMGDHGMDSTGNHGGESKDELESTIFFYSKSKKFIQRKDASAYNISDKGSYYRAVNQIDLVPTISLLLGLPIPYNNLGFPIGEVFGSDKELAHASYITLRQLQRYRDSSPELQDNTEQFRFLMDQYQHVGRKHHGDFIEACHKYQRDFLDHCKSLWARFDMLLIGLGITTMVSSLSILVTYSRSIPSVRVSTMSFEFIGSVIAMCLLGLVLSLSIFIVLKPDMSLKMCLLAGCAAGITVGFWAPVMDRFSVQWLWHQILDFFVYNLNSWSSLGLLFVVLHCAIFASNSYIVWEDKLVHFFMATFGFCCLYACITSSKPRAERILNAVHAVTLIISSRLVSSINLCREEQQPYCIPTFKTSWWSVSLLYVAAFMLPMFIKAFYKLAQSYHSAAPLWIETGLPFLMFMNAVYWTMEHLENVDSFQKNVPAWLSITTLKSVKLAIARIVLFVALVLANFSWSRGPLCVKIELGDRGESKSESASDEDEVDAVDNMKEDEKPVVTILGYGNVYGSSYFLFVINVLVAILAVSKPLGALSLCMMVIQLLSLLELFSFLELRRNLVSPVMLGVLGYQHYFSTGHQATIPSIQWDVGFITTQTIMFPFTHLNILLNTFGSFFIVCVAIPLITFWRLPPSPKPITVLSQIVTNVTTLLTYQTFTSVMSFIFAAHFRRHLMVWKIFAPRFMFSALMLIVFNVTLIGVTVWFATGRVLMQVNRIFGK